MKFSFATFLSKSSVIFFAAILLFSSALAVYAFVFLGYFSSPAYPEGAIYPAKLNGEIFPSTENVSVSPTLSYSLPLQTLPSEYENSAIANGLKFTQDKRVLLLRQGLVVLPIDGGNFSSVFSNLSTSGNNIFISSDAVLNYYVATQKKILLNIEKNWARSKISYVSKSLYDETLKTYNNSRDNSVKEIWFENLILLAGVRKSVDSQFKVTSVCYREFNEKYERFQLTVGNEISSMEKSYRWMEYYISNADRNKLFHQELFLSLLAKKLEVANDWQKITAFESYVYGISKVIDFRGTEALVKDQKLYGANKKQLLSFAVPSDFLKSSTNGINQPNSSGYDLKTLAAWLGSTKAKNLLPKSQAVSTITPDLTSYKGQNLWVISGLNELENKQTIGWQKTDGWQNKQIVTNFITWAKVNDTATEEQKPSSINSKNCCTSGNFYLEPSPFVYSRLGSISQYLYSGLSSLNIDSNLWLKDNQRLLELSSSLHAIAVKELAGQALNETDLGSLRRFASEAVSSAGQSQSADLLVVARKNTNGKYSFYSGPVFRYENNVEILASRTVGLPITGSSDKSWFTTTVNNANFNEKYDYGIVPQRSGTVRIPVLMYHHISESPTNTLARRYYVSPAAFERQLAYLAAKNYKTLTPYEFLQIIKSGKNPPQKSIMLTFDDGPRDNYLNAFPLLKKYGMTGVFYVSIKRCAIKDYELKEMAAAGMVIDSHTETHKDLRKISNAELGSEISGSRSIIRAIVGQPVYSIAYPGCVVDSRGIGISAGSGYLLGFSCGSSIDHKYYKRFSLSRVHAYNDMPYFIKVLSGQWYIPPF